MKIKLHTIPKNCPTPYRIMELPNTKGVVFMNKNLNLSKEEKELLASSLDKLCGIQKKREKYKYVSEADCERQLEFYRTIHDVYRLKKEGMFSGLTSIFEQRGVSVQGTEQVAKICKEYLYFVFGDATFDEDFPEVFDNLPVSQKSIKRINDEVYEEFCEGSENVIKQYKNEAYIEQNKNGYYLINVPAITIPEFSFEIDVSDETDKGNWEDIKDNIENAISVFPAIKEGASNDSISECIQKIFEKVDEQIEAAEENYEEISAADDDE